MIVAEWPSNHGAGPAPASSLRGPVPMPFDGPFAEDTLPSPSVPAPIRARMQTHFSDRLETGMEFLHELIGEDRKNRPQVAITPQSITIHNTSNDNPGADADAHSRFVRNTGHYMLNGKKNWVSWHFTVDDVRVIQQLPVNEMAWHVNSAANGSSIGIETCMHAGIDEAAANEHLAELVAGLCRALNLDTGPALGTETIRSHKSWTGKACPVRILPMWEDFIARVRVFLDAVPTEGAAPLDFARSEAGASLEGALGALGPDDAGPDDYTDIEHDAIAAALSQAGES